MFDQRLAVCDQGGALTRCRFSARTRLLATSFLVPVVASLSLSGALADDLGTGVDQSAPPAFETRWNGWSSFGRAWNSNTKNYGEIAVFAPFAQDENSLFFGEVRGRFFEDDLLAGNAALGVRKMTDSGFNFGAWVGLDVFETISDNRFGQISGGVEALSTHLDFRANGHLPFTDAQTAADGTADVILTGPDGDRRGEIYMIGGKEVAVMSRPASGFP